MKKETVTKYDLGYLPKIAYHMVHGNTAQVQYFTRRHIARYGELTVRDMGTISDQINKECERVQSHR